MPSSYVLGEHFEVFVKKQIESGRYASASEVVRDALRLLEETESLRDLQLKTLRARLREGAKSGPGIPADKVFDRLEAKYGRMADSF